METSVQDNRYSPFAHLSWATPPNPQESLINTFHRMLGDLAECDRGYYAWLAKRTLAELEYIRAAYSLSNITDQVAVAFRLAPDDLLAHTRVQRTAFARHVAMYLCRELTDKSFPVIGQHFGRDHSTTIYAYKLITKRVKREPQFAAMIEGLKRRITAGSEIVAKAA